MTEEIYTDRCVTPSTMDPTIVINKLIKVSNRSASGSAFFIYLINGHVILCYVMLTMILLSI